MKQLIKQYLDREVSRRNFLSGLGAFGITTVAANSMARSLAPFLPPAGDVDAEESRPSWMREMRGTGGALLVAQLKAAGIEYIFFNPSSGEGPIFDALVDEPNIHPIQAIHEGSLAAMADGYAKASGKTSFVLCARPGFPNAMAQMFNSWKDQIPVVVAVDCISRESWGQGGNQDADHLEEIAQPITKWHWVAQTTEKIPEVTRRALKFASTAPCGPVFMTYPSDTLHEEGKALIMDQAKFSVPMKIRPDSALVEQAARLLVEAQNPLLYVGDEIVRCGAQKEVVELAELLGLTVTRPPGYPQTIGWSKGFPTGHPLFIGDYLPAPQMRYPGEVDVMLNLGGHMPYAGSQLRMGPKVKLIEVRLDATDLARVYPTEVAMVADVKLALIDLLAAIRSMATAARLKQIREPRTAKTQEYTAKMRSFVHSIIMSSGGDGSLISVGRLGMELEEVLEKDTCFVAEMDSGHTMEHFMNFGGDNKQYFTKGGGVLGWGLAASFGVKLAQPDKPVVAVVGDGAFLFSGPQPLWSISRYRAAVTILVMNNRSYNNERNRMWDMGGRQFQMGRDMACYLGNPDVDFAKMASAFEVEGEIVAKPSSLRAALERAKRANAAEGRPYLLDVHVERGGNGAASTWHPAYSIEALRKKKG